MPSKQTIEIIKQTVPVLIEHGEALTRHFYKRMFTHDPQVAEFFNPAHQHTGTQQRALAGAICAYAQHIDNPEAITDAVELIAHKHASLGIKAEHYPIVGKHLLASIKELLGDAATEQIIDAWAEAYGILADIFIQREAHIYQEHEAEHGWTGFRPFTVHRKASESEVITSFYLKPIDGAPIGNFHAGQYLTIRVPFSDGGTTMRNYSISSAPGADHFRISVKREESLADDAPDGYVSHVLHYDITEGDLVEVGPPCGSFILDVSAPESRPLVLISGGVGVTPMIAMLHEVISRQPTRDIYFIHGSLNSRTHALGNEVHGLTFDHAHLRTHVRYSEPLNDDLDNERCDSTGFIDGTLIRSLVPSPDADFYYCGPKPFMTSVHQALYEWGTPEGQQYHEYFGPAEQLHAMEAH